MDVSLRKPGNEMTCESAGYMKIYCDNQYKIRQEESRMRAVAWIYSLLCLVLIFLLDWLGERPTLGQFISWCLIGFYLIAATSDLIVGLFKKSSATGAETDTH